MTLIADSERRDFEQVISDAGLSVGDFVLTDKKDEFPPGGIRPITGIVMVTFVPTNILVEYRAGHNSRWTIDFEHDLKANAFESR